MSLHAIDRSAGERLGARLGGASLLLATVLFMAVFGYLAAAFDYPDVLDRPAAEVLPRLLALGDQGRAAWTVYGLVPLLLVPTAMGNVATAVSVAAEVNNLVLPVWMAVLGYALLTHRSHASSPPRP